jgi:hypothetical protein
MVKSIDIGKNLKQNKFKITPSSSSAAAPSPPNFPFSNVTYRINQICLMLEPQYSLQENCQYDN